MADNDGQKHRSNTAGLKPPWKPGESGNPGGRPKGPSWSSLMQKYAEKKKRGFEGTWQEFAVDFLWKTITAKQVARKDKLKALDMLMDRMEGKPKQALDIKGDQRIVFNGDAEKYLSEILSQRKG